MFNIKFSVHSIDYETTFHTIFPLLLEKCRTLDGKHMIFRLVNELGLDAEPVLLGVIRHISAPTRDELLCQCMAVYGQTLTASLNKYLQNDSFGKSFTLGGVGVTRQEDRLLVMVEDVQADFPALLESQQVKDKIGSAVNKYVGKGLLGRLAGKAAEGALRAVTEMSPEDIEKSGAALLANSVVQGKLQKIVGDALVAKGIAVSLGDIEILTGVESSAGKYQGPLLTPQLETAVIHAIGEYLRHTVSAE